LIYQGSHVDPKARNYFKVALLLTAEAFMTSPLESLRCATLELVRSTPIKQRLICAYRRHLTAIPEELIPCDLRDTYEQVMRSLSGVPPLRGEDAVAASVRKMSNQEADDCAALIVDMFGRMSRAPASNVRNGGTLVKLHSVELSADTESAADFDVPALLAGHSH